MKLIRTLSIFTILLLWQEVLFSQITIDNEDNTIKATDLTVPSSPAFSLLEINPEKINRPGFSRDFKLDWFLQGNKLNPNIAFEMQPIWLLYYKNVDYNKYQSSQWIGRTLSTFNFSFGTVGKDSINSMAYSFKMTLYSDKECDPARNSDYINSIKAVLELNPEIGLLQAKIDKLQMELDTCTNEVRKKELNNEIKALKNYIDLTDIKQKEDLKKKQKDFFETHWNSTVVDIGYGNIFDYNNNYIDSLDFTFKKHAIWISGAYGIGNKWLVTGMYRQYFSSDNNDFLAGINVRYGNATLNFFAESVFEQLNVENKITLGYGGDYRVNSQLQVQFGIRTEYNEDFKMNQLIPMINLNWVMNNK